MEGQEKVDNTLVFIIRGTPQKMPWRGLGTPRAQHLTPQPSPVPEGPLSPRHSAQASYPSASRTRDPSPNIKLSSVEAQNPGVTARAPEGQSLEKNSGKGTWRPCVPQGKSPQNLSSFQNTKLPRGSRTARRIVLP